MPRPTARTTPNRSFDGCGTVAHVRRKVPICHNGASQIRPLKYPFPWTDLQTPYLPHPWIRPTYDAKGNPNPIRRFSTMHWTDRQTDARTDRQTTYRPRERRGLTTYLR